MGEGPPRTIAVSYITDDDAFAKTVNWEDFLKKHSRPKISWAIVASCTGKITS